MERKFKVWDKQNEKWIDNIDIAINQEGLLFVRHEGQTDFCPMSLTKSENFEVVYSVGREDENMKKVYEGDIVRFRIKPTMLEEDIGFVKWNKILYQFILIKNKKFCGYCEQIIEVIGNIYETPEKLKKLEYAKGVCHNIDNITERGNKKE